MDIREAYRVVVEDDRRKVRVEAGGRIWWFDGDEIVAASFRRMVNAIIAATLRHIAREATEHAEG